MKQASTHLDITRMAYNEAIPSRNDQFPNLIVQEYQLLKSMQGKVDSCLVEPSSQSVDRIMAALFKSE